VGVYARRRLAVVGALLVVVVGAVLALGDRGGSGGGAAPPSTTSTGRTPSRRFADVAEARLGVQQLHLAAVCDREDPVQDRLLRDYGALFVSAQGVTLPPACLLSEAATVAFQAAVTGKVQRIGGIGVRLQPAAADALAAAVAEAERQGTPIVPKAADAAARDYAATAELWRSRVTAGLAHWRRAGKLTRAEADGVAGLPLAAQIAEVLRLEGTGLLFGTHEAGPILSSVAAPGASQHLSLLAFDVRDYDDPVVLAAMADHGWFRTVAGDAPHFTYLGLAADELVDHGLREEQVGGRTYWVPDL
jgi:hypothetical protein